MAVGGLKNILGGLKAAATGKLGNELGNTMAKKIMTGAGVGLGANFAYNAITGDSGGYGKAALMGAAAFGGHFAYKNKGAWDAMMGGIKGGWRDVARKERQAAIRLAKNQNVTPTVANPVSNAGDLAAVKQQVANTVNKTYEGSDLQRYREAYPSATAMASGLQSMFSRMYSGMESQLTNPLIANRVAEYKIAYDQRLARAISRLDRGVIADRSGAFSRLKDWTSDLFKRLKVTSRKSPVSRESQSLGNSVVASNTKGNSVDYETGYKRLARHTSNIQAEAGSRADRKATFDTNLTGKENKIGRTLRNAQRDRHNVKMTSLFSGYMSKRPSRSLMFDRRVY